MALIAAYDIGGTKTELSIFKFSPFQDAHEPIACFERNGQKLGIQKLATQRFPTDRQKGIDWVGQQLNEHTQQLLKSSNIAPGDIDNIGMGLPGTVDPVFRYQTMGNTGIFNQVNLRELLSPTFTNSEKMAIANDANCFALAEAICGAAKDLKSGADHDQCVIGIILGTGVGGGIIINSRMMEGKNGGCAEIGHTVFSPDAPMCYCGQKGCVEQVLSGPAFESQFNARRYSQAKVFHSSAEIFDLAAKLDPIALASLKQYQHNLATFLTQLTNMFDPDAIILGGGMSQQPALYEGLAEKISKNRFVPAPAPLISQNVLGDSAGIIGAALIAYQALENAQ